MPLRAWYCLAASPRECCNSALDVPCDGPFRGYPDLVCNHRFQCPPLRKHGGVSHFAEMQRSDKPNSLALAHPGLTFAKSLTLSEVMSHYNQPIARMA